MAQSVVLDNTVLSNLAKVGRPDLVVRLWGDAACTTAVVIGEYRAGVERGRVPAEAWNDLTVVELTDEENKTAEELPPSLGAGEKSCLAIAHHRGKVIVTDDLDARKAASRLGLSTTGTVGILGLCVKNGVLSLKEGNQLLDVMIVQGYRAPVTKLEEIL
ncbi:MAG: DUF3368 domain-containing protein [bacterium]|nr:DUF3368 domain-containing protein [bacterium]